jgi:hypothetical protein
MYLYDPEGSGICHNIGVVALPAGSLKTNNNGWFTQSTKDMARGIFRNKAAGRDFIGLSTDHQLNEAMAQWNRLEDGPSGYGAGPARQVIHVEDVEILSDGHTVQFVSWWLNPNQPTYVHVVFPQGRGRPSPVGVIGFRQLSEPQFDDRLHMVSDSQDVERFRRNVGLNGHASLKVDGASCHFVSDRHGTRYFSPRHSEETGRRIEYSFKLGELQDITSEQPITGMGELVFVDKATGRELSSTEIGGVLNAHQLPPARLEPRLYIYRIDKVGRSSVINEPYWEQNRPRCKAFAAKHRQLTVPPEVDLDELEATRDAEGVVGVPVGQSLASAGRKLKWREANYEVIVTEVDFRHGPNGGIEGVVWYEDPTLPGRKFKTASGFSVDEKQAMMDHPGEYEGLVMNVAGYQGHRNRAVVFEGFHMDRDAADIRNDRRLNAIPEAMDDRDR